MSGRKCLNEIVQNDHIKCVDYRLDNKDIYIDE